MHNSPFQKYHNNGLSLYPFFLTWKFRKYEKFHNHTHTHHVNIYVIDKNRKFYIHLKPICMCIYLNCIKFIYFLGWKDFYWSFFVHLIQPHVYISPLSLTANTQSLIIHLYIHGKTKHNVKVLKSCRIFSSMQDKTKG